MDYQIYAVMDWIAEGKDESDKLSKENEDEHGRSPIKLAIMGLHALPRFRHLQTPTGRRRRPA